MELSELKELMSQFDQSSLTEFDLKEDSFELYFNKNKGVRGQTSAPVVGATPATETPAPLAASTVETTNSAASPKPATPAVAEGTEVVSPLVGVVYLKSSPDSPDFKAVGDTVKRGEVVCIVEAMKVMNEITSDIEGVVTEVLVENEQVVEYGQPLLRVKEGKA